MGRAATGLALLSFCLLAGIGFQLFKKETLLQLGRSKMQQNQQQVEYVEAQINQLKLNVEELSAVLAPVKSKKGKLVKKQEEINKKNSEIASNLEACNKEKAEILKRKNDVSDSLNKKKADQEKDKTNAEGEIKALKQQLLDRDKKVCQFVDKKQEEGRKLCETVEAPK